MPSTPNNIIQGGAKVYYADALGEMINIGILHEDGIDSTLMDNIAGVGSATTGEGKVAHFTGGTTGEFTMKLREFDKYILSEIFQQTTSTGTSELDGTAGTVNFGTDAGKRILGRRLVIYPMGTDEEGVQFTETATNPYAVEIYKAVCTSDFVTSFKPDTPNEIELTFEPQVDLSKTNGSKIGKIGNVTL
jgi:hypothetical protein